MERYYNEFNQLLQKIKNCKISKEEVRNYLVNYIDCEYIYNTDDTLLSDIFFTLKHFSMGEEDITNEEIRYFLECLNGERTHSFDEKMELLHSKIFISIP